MKQYDDVVISSLIATDGIKYLPTLKQSHTFFQHWNASAQLRKWWLYSMDLCIFSENAQTCWGEWDVKTCVGKSSAL